MAREFSLAFDCGEANRLLGYVWLGSKNVAEVEAKLDDHVRGCAHCKAYNLQLELKEAAKVQA